VGLVTQVDRFLDKPNVYHLTLSKLQRFPVRNSIRRLPVQSKWQSLHLPLNNILLSSTLLSAALKAFHRLQLAVVDIGLVTRAVGCHRRL